MQQMVIALCIVMTVAMAACGSGPPPEPSTPLDEAAKATAVAKSPEDARATAVAPRVPTPAPALTAAPAQPAFPNPFAVIPALLGPDPARPSLTRSGDTTSEAWLQQWTGRLPITASLKKGTTSQFLGVGVNATYRVYTVHVELKNDTKYRLSTGTNQYLVETAQQPVATGPGDLLVVAGGSFRKRPTEDFAAISERRDPTVQGGAFPMLQDEADVQGPRFGNEHVVSADGSQVRVRGPNILLDGIGMFGAPTARAVTFGEAGAGERLGIDSDLQFGVMVADGRLGAVQLISPELRFADEQGGQAAFRYLLRFEAPSAATASPAPTGAAPGAGDVEWMVAESRLLPLTAEALAPLVANAQAPLWQRVFASHWLVDVDGPNASATLLPLVTMRGQENDALRATAIDAAARTKALALVAPATGILNDAAEAFSVRMAAMRALARLGEKSIMPTLLSLVGSADQDESTQAVRALGLLGDRSAVPDLMKILETPARSTLHPTAGDALGRLADNGSLDRLAALARTAQAAGKPGVAAAPIASAPAAAVRAIGGIDTPESIAVLAQLFQGSPQLQSSICYALSKSERPEAVALLKQALASGDKTVGFAAVSALTSRGSPERIAALREVLKQPNPEAQAQAATALGRLKAAEARDDLLGLLGDASAPAAAREQAARALGQFPSPESERALRQALTDADPAVKKGAVGGLRLLGLKAAVSDIAPLLADQDAQVRSTAADFTGWAGDLARTAALLDAMLAERDAPALGNEVTALIALQYQDLGRFDEIVQRLRSADQQSRFAFQRLLNHLTGQNVTIKFNPAPADIDAAVAAWTTAAQEKGRAR